MKFTTRARYGLRAMVDLAQNYSPHEPVPLIRVAQRQEISEGYLEQLMTYLRKGGLVRSVRGAQGGYLLAKEPARITAGEVIRCLEGPINPTGCVSESEPEACIRAEACATRGMWEKIRVAIVDVLDNTTLEDLCVEAEKILQSKEAGMYNI
ncbi:MAG: HTH-type transcriptional regulator CymR [Pelotomaculum sp. PtaB.Bin104]|nr:MAG: HTH-type transcriptional regulator CymR [Pelotomaculum sp. PtaB.Bin104]